MNQNPDIVLYEQHNVYSVDFSPEGLLLASAVDDGSIRISYPTIIEDLWHFEASRGVRLVRFSPDGRFVAAGGWGEKLYVWDIGTGAQRHMPTSPYNRFLDFSPLTKMLAAVGSDGSCELWDVEAGRQVGDFYFYGDAVEDFGFSSDGTLCAVAQGEEVHIWDAKRQGLLRSFGKHEDIVRKALFSPDGRFVCSGDDLGSLMLWDVHTLRTIWSTPRRDTGIRSLAFDHSGNHLAVADDDYTFKLLDARSGETEIPPYFSAEIFELTFSHVDRWLAVGGANGLRVWYQGSEIVHSDKLPGATAQGWTKPRPAARW